MDPNATFRELLDAVLDRDAETMLEKSIALRDWLSKGGFAPNLAEPKNRRHLLVWCNLMASVAYDITGPVGEEPQAPQD